LRRIGSATELRIEHRVAQDSFQPVGDAVDVVTLTTRS
jgi:hypothetical protein